MRTPEELRREADALDEVDAGLGASLRSAADEIERLRKAMMPTVPPDKARPMSQRVTIRVKARTPMERAADQFDAELYRLITHAETHAQELRGGMWGAIADALRSARPMVRKMMHENDLVDTD